MTSKQPYTLIPPGELNWRLSNLMKLPNADILERTGSDMLSARLWRLPPKSASTWHKHVNQEEFYFLLEGAGRIRINESTFSIEKHGSVHVHPDCMRQVFNDSDEEALWLIVGAPETEVLPAQGGNPELFYPEDPTQLPPEMKGVIWPPLDTTD